MPYCENCGSPINPNAKFCGKCGAAQNQAPVNQPPVNVQPKNEQPSYYSSPSGASFSPPPPPPVMHASTARAQPRMQPATAPAPQAGGESTVGVILFRRMKSLGRYDAYAGVVTTQRLIFAQLTSEMLTAAAQQARDQAKAEGKGFWGQWSDQLKGTFGYTKKYLTMPSEAILAETPGNFALYNNTISEIKVKTKGNQERQVYELEAEIHSTQGRYEFRMDENSDFTDLLKRVYGGRVKMPFGYFSKSVNIKF